VTKFGLLVGKNNAGIIYQEKRAVEDIAGGGAGEGWWRGLQIYWMFLASYPSEQFFKARII
jgi:hypothetical protein